MKSTIVLLLLTGLPFAPSVFAEDTSPDAKRIKEFEAKGFQQCKRDPNYITCQIRPGHKPTAEEAKVRDGILAQYSGYEGGESPVGTFGVTRVLGESSYDDYDIQPEKGAVLSIYESPKEGAKEIQKVIAGASRENSTWIEGIQVNYNTFVPDNYFYDVKNSFLKVKFSSKNTKGWGWIRASEVDRVRGFKDLATRIVGLDPEQIKVMSDSPAGKSSSLGSIKPGRSYSFEVAETKLVNGKFWLKIGHAQGNSCADGTEDTDPHWVGRWIEYRVDFIEFKAPC